MKNGYFDTRQLVRIPVIQLILVAMFTLVFSGSLTAEEKVKPARFPIGFWPTGLPAITEAMMDDWAEAGITLTYACSNNMKQVLDWADARGIQIILQDKRGEAPRQNEKDEVPPDYQQKVRSLVEEFGNHPAAFGFKISDEPSPSNFRSVLACAEIASRNLFFSGRDGRSSLAWKNNRRFLTI